MYLTEMVKSIFYIKLLSQLAKHFVYSIVLHFTDAWVKSISECSWLSTLIPKKNEYILRAKMTFLKLILFNWYKTQYQTTLFQNSMP